MSRVHRIEVLLKPRGSRDEILGVDGLGRVAIRVKAAPVENAANDAAIRIIAKTCKVPKQNVRIVRGATSREKVVEIEAADDAIRKLKHPSQ